MGQGEVLKLVEKSKKPLKATEITKKLNSVSRTSVGVALKKLRESGEIGWKFGDDGDKISYIYFKKK